MAQCIEISGIRIGREEVEDLLVDRPGADFSGFRSRGRPDLTLTTRSYPLAQGSFSLGESTALRVGRNGSSLRIFTASPELELGRLDAGKRKAVFNRYNPELEYLLFQPFLRICLHFLLLEHNGLLLHSCGMERDGKGYLFSGASGSGKTTVSLMFSGDLLSDEYICIKKQGRDYRIHSTPWRGKKGEARLKKIFFLKKASRLSFTRLSREEAFRAVLSNTFTPPYNGSVASLLSVISGVSARIPAYRMGFSLDSGISEGIKELEREEKPCSPSRS